MEIKETKIGEYIFTKNTNRRKFRIPDYQRPYVWDEERVEEFWNDLIDPEISLPFLGSFIFQANENSDFYDIVDGQQRIITMSILLSVLRNLAGEISDDRLKNSLKSSIQQRMTDLDNLGNEKAYFLKCWEDTQNFFEKYILKSGGNIFDFSDKLSKKEITKCNIVKNYKILYGLAKEFTCSQNGTDNTAIKIDEILNKLDELLVVYIKVDNDMEAYTAFEIVNARGQELGNIDLLKNLFFKEATIDGNKEMMVERWEKMVKNISDCSETKVNFETFLKHFWHSQFGDSKNISSKKLYKVIKDHIDNVESGENYKVFSEKMLDHSRVYKSFFDLQDFDWIGSGNKQDRYNRQILKSLKYIRGFGITQAYVLFLSLVRNREEIGARKVRALIKAVEKFHFAYSAISKLPGNKVEKLYGKYAEHFDRACKNDKNTEQEINKNFDRFLNELKKLFPTRSEFIERFEYLSYKSSNYQNIRYVFSQMEIMKEGGDGELEIDFSNANIEHIQSRDLRNANNEFIEEGGDEKINSIGNLVILSIPQNSRAGNLSIDDKVKIYKESHLKIVQDLVEKIEKKGMHWGVEDIDGRSKEMAGEMYDFAKELRE